MVTIQSAPEAWKAATPSLYILDGGVGFNVAENRVSKSGSIKQVGDFFRHAEFDQIRVRADKRFFVPAGGELGDNVFDGTVAMVRDGIEDNAVSHNNHTLLFTGQSRWITKLSVMQIQQNLSIIVNILS